MADSKLANPNRDLDNHLVAMAKLMGKPQAPANANREALGKLGHEVATFLQEWRELSEDGEPPALVRIPPDEVGVCPRNRGGAPPNLQVLHKRITASFEKHGYDPSRHLPCIVVHYKSEKGRKDLVSFNQKWSEGRVGFPKVNPKKMRYGTLAGSHLTLAVRCTLERMVTPQKVDLGKVRDDDPKLAKVADQGLEYIILQEETPLDAQDKISSWRNQGQHSNLVFHEFEMTQAILDVAKKHALKGKGKVEVGPLAGAVMRSAPVTLTPHRSLIARGS